MSELTIEQLLAAMPPFIRKEIEPAIREAISDETTKWLLEEAIAYCGALKRGSVGEEATRRLIEAFDACRAAWRNSPRAKASPLR
jgi:hypothetical protein